MTPDAVFFKLITSQTFSVIFSYYCKSVTRTVGSKRFSIILTVISRYICIADFKLIHYPIIGFA